MSQQALLERAMRERTHGGYVRPETRDELEDIGMTNAQIEAALINMENHSGN